MRKFTEKQAQLLSELKYEAEGFTEVAWTRDEDARKLKKWKTFSDHHATINEINDKLADIAMLGNEIESLVDDLIGEQDIDSIRFGNEQG